MTFAQPHLLWFLAVTLGLLLWFLAWAWRRKQQLIRQFVQARLLPQLTVGVSPGRQKLRLALLLAAIAALFLALARPQWGFEWEEARQRGLDIVVAIDTSRSMLAGDVRPNRLARAKLAALDLMRLARTDRLALIAFAGSAYLQCPLTLDDQAFRQNVEALDTHIIPQGGTALAQAIETAVATYSKDTRNFKILVLISDGEDHDPGALAAAGKAAEAGLRIYTLGAGTPAGEILPQPGTNGTSGYIKDSDGNVVKSRLNEPLLQQIATATGGFYLPLRSANVIETLYEKGLAPLPKSETASRLFQHFHERFQWPLGFAILLLLIELFIPEQRRLASSNQLARPGRTPPRIASLLLLFCAGAALHASPAHALRQYQAGQYPEAAREYQDLLKPNPDEPALNYNAGTATYRTGDYANAARAFSNALHAVDLNLQENAYYNLGNTLYRQGEETPDLPQRLERWEDAVRSLTSATKLDPKDPDAAHNLEFVKRRLEELRQQMPKQPQSDPKDSKDQKDQKEKQEPKGKPDNQDSQPPNDQKDQPQDSKDPSKPQPKPSSQPQAGDDQNPPKPQSGDKNQPESSRDESGSEPKANQPSPAKPPESARNPAKEGQGNPEPRQPQSGSPDQPQPGEPGDPAAAAGSAVPAGQMTQQQAQQLLEAQKGDERILMFVPKPPANGQPRSFKDW